MKIINSIYYKILFISAIILLITFPEFETNIGIGLDYGYMWAINHFFFHQPEMLGKLVYPIGPLGFIMYPMAVSDGLLFTILFFVLIKFIFISTGLLLCYLNDKKILTHKILFILFLSYIIPLLDFYICSIVAFSILIYNYNNNKIWVFIAIFLCVISLYMKVSFGLAATSILAIYSIIQCFYKNGIARLFLIGAIFIAIYWIIGLLIFRNLLSPFLFLGHSTKLAFNYSSALALYPENNWLLLFLFWVSFIIFLAVNRNKKTLFVFIILIPSVFLFWKHGIVREDASHISKTLIYVIVFWIIIAINEKRYRLRIWIWPVLSVFVFFLNLKNINGYDNIKVEMIGINNFIKTFFDYKTEKEKYTTISYEAFKENILPDTIKKIIGQKTVDIYPWDITFVPINNLNWKPRRTLEMGSYSDKYGAENFTNANGSDFILQHLEYNNYGSDLASLDQKYLLNEEPITINEIIKNYALVFKNNKFIIWRKGMFNDIKENVQLEENRHWGEWVNVPKFNNQLYITKVKIDFSETLPVKIKTFLYKDDPFFIDYLFEDSTILRYRIVPASAKNGIWINPLIENIHDNSAGKNVKKIRFIKSSLQANCGNIKLSWINFSCNLYTLLKKDTIEKKPIINTLNSFDTNVTRWSEGKLDSVIKFSGKYSNCVVPNGYSSTFTVNSSSFLNKDIIKLYAGVQLFSKKATDSRLIISLESQGKTIDYYVEYLNTNIFNNEWQPVSIRHEIDLKGLPDWKISIYIWNPDKETIYVDNFSVKAY